MTHEELLAKIDSELVTHGQRGNIVKHSFALRAVVETVEAFEGRGVIANLEFDQGVRSACRVIIEAIEKELQ